MNNYRVGARPRSRTRHHGRVVCRSAGRCVHSAGRCVGHSVTAACASVRTTLVTAGRTLVHALSPVFARPGSWALWRERPRVIGYLLALDTAGALAVLLVLARGGLTALPGVDWVRAGVLAAAATLHLAATRQLEEQRRHDREPGRVHSTDLGTVWSVAAVLALPLPLALGCLLIGRAQRWPHARTPTYRYTASTAAVLLAGCLGHAAWRLAGPHPWTDRGLLGSVGVLVGAVAVGELYGLVQQVLVRTAVVLTLDLPRERPDRALLLTTARDELVGVGAIGLAVLAALALTHLPAATLLVAGLTIGAHRALGLHAELARVRADARLDAKTGVLNPLGWAEQAGRRLDQARRAGTPTAVLMVDADHFKQINDRFGHPTGDAVLREFGRVLRANTRARDVVARFGGEEFVVALPRTGRKDALALAEGIRRALAAAPCEANGHSLRISASIGVHTIQADADCDVDAAFEVADRAMYEAKAGGRNCVRSPGGAALARPQ